jgi:phosphate transport system substrate-binding protein
MLMKLAFRIAAAALGLSVFVGAAGAAVTLNGAGATFPEPIYQKWFYEFYKGCGVKVNYQGIGSGGGIQAMKSGTVDFGGTDAPLDNNSLKYMPGPMVQIPTCGGAVALAHTSGVPNLQLSPSTLAGIFLGQIKTWNDAKIKADNPAANLPAKAITVVHRSDGSGTTFLFTTYLSAVSPTWKSKCGAGKEVRWPCGQGGKGNPGVAGLVKQLPGAIGYVELTYALTNQLPTAALKNASGQFVKPSLQSATACIEGSMDKLKADVRTPIVNATGAGVYPITGLTFIMAYTNQKDDAKGGELVHLLKWCMGDGAQDMAAAYQYAPLPAALIQTNLALIAKIK